MYYDWQKTLSYDADLTVVTGARGIGKTYGIRAQSIRDYIKRGLRFVEVTRYAEQLKGDSSIQNGYFDRLQLDPEFAGWLFQTKGVRAYIARKPVDDAKPEWQCIGYFVALTQANKLKQRTFLNVRNIIFDEAILDPMLSQYQRYLTGEFELLMNIVDTVSREHPDSDSVKPRIFCLGNAVDLLNPYFIAMGVGDKPEFGYHWYKGKTMLLHYPDPGEYADAKASQTVAGRLLANSDTASDTNIRNIFIRHDDGFFKHKPKNARFAFGIHYKRKHYGIWLDASEGYYYVNSQIPNNAEPVYSLTADDARPNYIAAKRMQRSLKGFTELYYMGVVRYENEAIRQGFIEALSLFGVR